MDPVSAPPAERSFAEEMPGAITWSWNVATGEVSWGEGIEGALFGLPVGGFGGTFEAYLALVHPDDRAYFHAVIERTLAGEDEYVMSHRVLWPDGSTHWIDGRGHLSRDGNGRPLLLSGVAWTQAARKVEEERRRAAEEAVRRSEERYRALVEQAADAIFLASAADVLLEVNAAACEMTGRTREELIGTPLGELLVPSKSGGARVGSDSPRGPRVTGERTLRRKDGSTIDVELTGTVLADGCVQSYARNITERKLVQQQLILSDRLASLGRLAAGVAHEINNPLGYLALALETVERAVSADELTKEALAEVRTAIAGARDGAGRVRVVVQALSALSRDDEGSVGRVDLHRVLDGAVRLTENNLRHRGRIIKDYHAVHSVRGNDLRLGQVFVNLLVNACDALREDTPDANEIRVSTFEKEGRVVVEVHDNGTGIATEIRSRIFDPFFTTKPVGRGTGLGLAISHGIVSSFGGEIGFDSPPAKGTTFWVSLAVDHSTVVDVARSMVNPGRVPRFRLLIVDDEVRLARSLAALLSFHDVEIASSVAEALTLIEKSPFDCVLCDLMMPSLSGMDLHAELERRGRGEERRMVFMTGGAFTPRAREFVAKVPNHVLEKPFSADAVETLVASIVAGKA